jgi:hypothetical protein
MPWYKQSSAFQRRAAVNHRLRWFFPRADGNLPLPTLLRGAILASKRSGIWRMSEKAGAIIAGQQLDRRDDALPATMCWLR